MSINHTFHPKLQVNASLQSPSSSYGFSLVRTSIFQAFSLSAASIAAKHPCLVAGIGSPITNFAPRVLDFFTDSIFQFEDQPTIPYQDNFAPVEEIGEAVLIECLEGIIPIDFPQGVYIRNGPNPLFGALKSTSSVLGKSQSTWIEGEGMLHAIYFEKDSFGKWCISYKNKYVESDTFKIEKERNKPCFLPALEGDSHAILAAYLLNMLRFGKVNKYISNTNVFEHAGKCYAIAENHSPQEIDISNLHTVGEWHLNGSWQRPFTSHPKTVPRTGELVIMGVDAKKPFLVVGVISADGKDIVHKVDVKLERSSLCHDIGITDKYNVILDLPLVIDINRLIKGGPLMKFEKEGYARIGVMPRYGCSDSIKWFDIAPTSMFHIFNCFEEGDEVIVRGCTARGSIIPGPEFGENKFEWFSKGFKPIPTGKIRENCSPEEGLFFTRAYEWSLNMRTGEVRQRYLTGTDFSMDFPFINNYFAGCKNKFGYSQVVDTPASIICGLGKYGGLAKLYFEELDNKKEGLIKVEYHKLEENQFCSGAVFVPKVGAVEEDDGYIISFIHNEMTDASQVIVMDAKNIAGQAVAKLTLPRRVPYGFHGAYTCTENVSTFK